MRRHRPARRPAGRLGPDRLRQRAGEVRAHAAEALGPQVAAVKPQSAFFERFGSRGVAVLEQVIATAREAGALVVLDVKRGDIGSTAQAYADAYLDPRSPIAADAVTAAPYLGFGSLEPMFATAREHGAGRVRAGADLQPRGAAVPARPHRRRAAPSPARCSPSSRGSTAGPRRWAPSAPWSAPPSRTPTRTWPSTARCWCPGSAPRAAPPTTYAGSSAASSTWCCPSSSREILSAGPDAGALHDAVGRAARGLRGAPGRPMSARAVARCRAAPWPSAAARCGCGEHASTTTARR